MAKTAAEHLAELSAKLADPTSTLSAAAKARYTKDAQRYRALGIVVPETDLVLAQQRVEAANAIPEADRTDAQTSEHVQALRKLIDAEENSLHRVENETRKVKEAEARAAKVEAEAESAEAQAARIEAKAAREAAEATRAAAAAARARAVVGGTP